MKSLLQSKKILPLFLTGSLLASFSIASDVHTPEKPIVLKTMGSLFFGGKVETAANGETFHGDHGYAQYYIPAAAKNYPIIMWHGIGQSGKTYESTPDGREGYMQMLSCNDWPVYIIDQPRRGRAGRTTAPMADEDIPTLKRESSAVNACRMGRWVPPGKPEVKKTLAVPKDAVTSEQ